LNIHEAVPGVLEVRVVAGSAVVWAVDSAELAA
jgi:hypothetical protein